VRCVFSYFQERKRSNSRRISISIKRQCWTACQCAVGCFVRVLIYRRLRMECHQVQYVSNKLMDRSKTIASSRQNLVTSIRATMAESKSRLPPNPNDLRHFAYDLDNRELIARSIKTSQASTRSLGQILMARRTCPFRRTRHFDHYVPMERYDLHR
jgi:hypothetical protein